MTPPAPGRFGARLVELMAARGPLCVGIDPHPELLREWGLDDDPGGLERFARTAVDALAGEIAVLKPQSAFFERHGSAGIAVLERTLAQTRDAGALVLLDVKRGDIGSTMSAYAQAYLADGAPLAADAITVSPYLGVGSLEPAFALAARTGRGVFVLARTSNPEGAPMQRSGPAQFVVDALAERNAGGIPLGDLGVVVGATVEPGELDLDALNGPVLAPGVGAQGATVDALPRIFGSAPRHELPRHVLPATARDVLRHGPDPAGMRAAALRVRDAAAALISR
ncbi:MAG: orotidine-5'-phosphate decarboxylase [Actinomycetota bacterium]|nr:orotidine-5'-phosphate decarboxylase [Actinomycetota bacterium]